MLLEKSGLKLFIASIFDFAEIVQFDFGLGS